MNKKWAEKNGYFYLPYSEKTVIKVEHVPSDYAGCFVADGIVVTETFSERIERLANIDKEDPNIKRLGNDLYCYHQTVGVSASTNIDLPYGTYRYLYGNHPLPERLKPMATRNDAYFSNQDLIEYIKSDIRAFLDSRSIYNEMGVLYKRGYLFYGPPGNGKTGFIRHLVDNLLPKNSHVMWITEIPSNEMLKELNKLETLKVFVIEEVITRNNDPEFVKQLLGFLDGEESTGNTIVIGTTNYPELLEANLADRKGRFDLCIEIPQPNEEETKSFLSMFLRRELTAEELASSYSNLSVAHIKEMCLAHKISGKSLKECYDGVMVGRKNFKNNFKKSSKIGL